MRKNYRISSARLYSQEIGTRIPFRYGIATMTRLPHVFLEVELVGPTGSATGLAADHLPPKWFTKDPNAAVADEIATMRKVILHAAALATGASFNHVFELWRELWLAQDSWALTNGHPPLLAHFGNSLVERAVIDAFCRLENITFAEAINANRLGLDFSELDPTLPRDWRRLLPAQPLTELIARHTVGLVDKIYERDLDAAGSRINDGLPQSLEAAVRAYGLQEFKIKFCGQWEQDSPRLEQIFACLEKNAPAGWRYSLDGNESFGNADSFRSYWNRLSALPWLRQHLGRLLFIEQPVGRAKALQASADWRSWSDAPPIIIDESDGELQDLPHALALGYAGSSHKNCKGIIKGILNRCRIAAAQQSTRRPLLMSGEDLSNIGPVAVLQDLAVQAVLGNDSVERNGHHYFCGLSMWPETVQHAVADAHPDLYDSQRGFCSLKINGGRLQLGSVLRAPFGYGAALDPGSFCTSSETLG